MCGRRKPEAGRRASKGSTKRPDTGRTEKEFLTSFQDGETPSATGCFSKNLMIGIRIS